MTLKANQHLSQGTQQGISHGGKIKVVRLQLTNIIV